jgi:hypothetical protein
MKSLKIILKKLEEKGVQDAEKVILDVFGAVQESCPEIVADGETSGGEKAAAGVLIPVLAGLKPAVEKLADLNHDGKIG